MHAKATHSGGELGAATAFPGRAAAKGKVSSLNSSTAGRLVAKKPFQLHKTKSKSSPAPPDAAGLDAT